MYTIISRSVVVYLLLLSGAFSLSLGTIMQRNLKNYYLHYKKSEHFSGLGLAIGLKGSAIRSAYIGRMGQKYSSRKVNQNALFQIGSITKSFTAAIILQLVKEGKLKLSDKVGQFLPQYLKWGPISIAQLLNMSSGLPNYSDTPSWNYFETLNIERVWHIPELLSFAYPPEGLNPPLKKGYFYTNTGYLIADLIIQKVTKLPFKLALEKMILQPAKLQNAYYPIPNVSKKHLKRLMHGYAFNQYDNPELLGHDMRLNNLTWAGAAGGMIATTPTIVQWVRDLFVNSKLLTKKQRQQLMQMISLKTGKLITETSADDPKGFVLGVIQAFNPKIGRFWYYEGETLGFRAIYMYTPCNKIIIAATVNSATNSQNDHIHQLLMDTYKQLLKAYPRYQCNS